MPELPDIELYLSALRPRVLDRRLEAVRIASPFLLRSVDPPVSSLPGRAVTGLRRLGKRIVFGLDGEYFVILHLMIAGRLWCERARRVWPPCSSPRIWPIARSRGCTRRPVGSSPPGSRGSAQKRERGGRRRSPRSGRAWRFTADIASRAPCVGHRCNGSATPATRRTTAPAVRPAGGCWLTGRCRGS